jgi:hypothetical protein
MRQADRPVSCHSTRFVAALQITPEAVSLKRSRHNPVRIHSSEEIMSSAPVYVGVCVIAVMTLAGCSPAPLIETVPVSGTLVYQGKPVKGASVSFMNTNVAGHCAAGVTDDQGRFSLQTPLGGPRFQDGSVEGTFKVVVISDVRWPQAVPEGTNPAAFSAEDMRAVRERMAENQRRWQRNPGLQRKEIAEQLQSKLPKKYTSMRSTDLVVTVKAGSPNDFRFELDDEAPESVEESSDKPREAPGESAAAHDLLPPSGETGLDETPPDPGRTPANAAGTESEPSN